MFFNFKLNKEQGFVAWLPEESHSLAASSTHQLESETGKGSMRCSKRVCVCVCGWCACEQG